MRETVPPTVTSRNLKPECSTKDRGRVTREATEAAPGFSA